MKKTFGRMLCLILIAVFICTVALASEYTGGKRVTVTVMEQEEDVIAIDDYEVPLSAGDSGSGFEMWMTAGTALLIVVYGGILLYHAAGIGKLKKQVDIEKMRLKGSAA